MNEEVFDIHQLVHSDFKETGGVLTNFMSVLNNRLSRTLVGDDYAYVAQSLKDVQTHLANLMMFTDNTLFLEVVSSDIARRRLAMGYRMAYIMLTEQLDELGYKLEILHRTYPGKFTLISERIIVHIGRKDKLIHAFSFEELRTLTSLEEELQ